MALLGESHQSRERKGSGSISHISFHESISLFIRERGTAADESAYCATRGNFHALHTSRDEEDVALAPVVIAPKRVLRRSLASLQAGFLFPWHATTIESTESITRRTRVRKKPLRSRFICAIYSCFFFAFQKGVEETPRLKPRSKLKSMYKKRSREPVAPREQHSPPYTALPR